MWDGVPTVMELGPRSGVSVMVRMTAGKFCPQPHMAILDCVLSTRSLLLGPQCALGPMLGEDFM